MSDIAMSRRKIAEFLMNCSKDAEKEVLLLIPIFGTEAVAQMIDDGEFEVKE